ncbi:STT3 domain-containing protein [Candidatus Nanosalina sp. VS9-1]|uniref:STT3 domain-containing protein n=1 Tax=Candidatus Nanosalina sp. VS9-1 TaxID=3388566 RepID=UPI0039E170B3
MSLERYKEKVKDNFSREGLKNNWAFLAVAAVFGVALWLRYLPEQGMQNLQALDPYMIFRMSQHLAYEGAMPVADFMRYFPYSAPTYLLNIGDIVFPAILYWMGPSMIFENYLEWAQFYPALMGALSTVVMYFFGKEVANKRVGIFSAFFLAVIPGVMRRSSAGFFEKEPIGTFFMMLTLLFFARAWKRESYISGILSGLSLAFFTISWGGSRMLWLLLPLVVGSLIFIDEEVHELIVAYTPTVLVGGGVAAALNYNRYWITGTLFVANIGLLGLLWSRYLIEELDLVKEKNLKYYVPTVSITGLIFVLLSPLYSNFIASKLMSIINMVTQTTGGDVIGGTVAENTAPGLSNLITSLGAETAGSIHPVLGTLASIVGSWPMMMLGIGFMGSTVAFMLLKKYGLVESEVSDKIYFAGFETVFLSWMLLVTGFFEQLLIFSALAALTVIGMFIAFTKYLDDDYTFKLVTMVTGTGLVLEILMLFSGAQIAYTVIPATALVLAGLVALYYNDRLGSREIEMEWIIVLPLAWVITNLLGSVAKSRIIFLSTFAVAFAAGYGLAKIIGGLENMDLNEVFEFENTERLKYAAIAIILILTVAVNFSAGFINVQSVSGSPNQAWDQSLNYMDEQTPDGSVVMSWWDYGYHFQTIGRTASVADGGNAGYYSNEVRATNMPLADFLTSDDPMNTPGLDSFLEQHSVDYILLDNTMIGKYSAVSTISNGAANLPNESTGDPSSMLTLSTSANIQDSISQSGNTTTVTFTSSRGLQIYAPVQISNNSISLSDEQAPTLQQTTGRGTVRQPIDCILTENGKIEFDVDTQIPYCLAEDPYFNLERGFQTRLQAQSVLVPKEISDSQLVELYIQDGEQLDYVEKVEEASNDYVKMWKVTKTE